MLVAASVSVVVAGGGPPPAGTASPAGPSRTVAFEANQGQADPDAAYLSRGPGYGLFLTPTEAVLALDPRPDGGGTAVLRLTPLGARPTPPTGLDLLPGVVNSYVGNDPARWRAGVPTYATVAQRGVYPGIDLLWHGRQGELEYDFVVAPGSDPGVIRMGVQGADSLSVDAQGDLQLATPGGVVTQRRPVVYQEISGHRRAVAADYAVSGSTVALRLGGYDRGAPLVIDPVVAYGTYLGGGSDDIGMELALDASGNVYVTGRTGSTDFPTTAGLDIAKGGLHDAFVTKLGPTGAVVYSTYLGGAGVENTGGPGPGSAIAVNGSEAFVTGTTTSTDFPASIALGTSLGGAFDAFVARLDSTGALGYARYLGGGSGDVGNGIAVDATANAYVTGNGGTGFPVTPGAGRDTTIGGVADAFVTRLSPTGTITYSVFAGGTGIDVGFDVAIDGTSNAYVTGRTEATDFPTTAALDTTLGGTSDAFVAKLDASGAAVYGTYLGGGGADNGMAVAVDGTGQAHVTGTTESDDFPATGGLDTMRAGGEDAYVARLTAGGAISWATYLGGGTTDRAGDVAVDAAGRVFASGETGSADFPTTPGMDRVRGTANDAYATRFSSTGKVYASTFLGGSSGGGGSGGDGATGIAVDGSAKAYVTGQTASIDFPVTAGLDTTYAGIGDAFVAKLDLRRPTDGDYDADGDTDVGVFRPAIGTWFVSGGATTAFGTSGDVPVPGDYDADGDTGIAVFRPSSSLWFVSGGAVTAFGTSGDVPAPGDYDGDGDTDIAVFRPSMGTWFVSGGAVTAFGTSGDVPVPGDYDGDGDTGVAVFRPSTGLWYLSGGPVIAFGTTGDIALPLAPSIRLAFFP